MKYNTSRSKLFYREYGRNIQQLVEYAVSIEDDEKRNKVVLAIIDLMGQLNPHLKNIDDFKHKLWDHIHILSDFKLEIDSIYPIPTREELSRKPEHIGYPKNKIQFKHYGKNVETLVKKAVETEDEEKQKEFAECIGNYMKLVHKNWNNEDVSNEIIINDLASLSNNEIKLDEQTNLDTLSRTIRRKKRPSGSQNKNKNQNKRRPRKK